MLEYAMMAHRKYPGMPHRRCHFLSLNWGVRIKASRYHRRYQQIVGHDPLSNVSLEGFERQSEIVYGRAFGSY
jgi:hypothetical protein